LKLFFDTSALVKLFHIEAGSDAVAAMVLEKANQVWVLDLVRGEFASAMYRRRRNNEIDDNQLETALSGFDEQLRFFNVHPLNTEVLNNGIELLKKLGKTFGLRTLDALHLGAYSLLQGEDWAFVCSDRNLVSAAEHTGFRAINPTD
jgi:predicted nucleic acid-binding protein